MKSILKDKKRYLLFKVFSEGEINEKEIAKEIYKTLGILYPKVNPKIIYLKDNFGIIKTTPNGIDDLERALAIITNVNKKKAHLLPLRISGTIRKLKTILSEMISMK